MDLELLKQLAVALGLGLLVGFQREWTAPHVAGIRTFALITVLGTLSGRVANEFGGWIVAAVAVVLGAMLIVRNLEQRAKPEMAPGMTTQMAALLMYLAGVALVFLPLEIPLIIGGTVVVLLHWKAPLHRFVDRMGEPDVRAIIELVLFSLVILPVLPDKTYDRYEVLNPFQIWLLVVLICGISVGGYVIYKFVRGRAGIVLIGLLGGVISSTATTVSYARRSRRAVDSSHSAALIIAIASTVVFVRVIVEMSVVAPGFLPLVLPPILTMMFIMGVTTAGLYCFTANIESEPNMEEDPSNLKAAVAFGALYVVVLFAVAVAKEHFGNSGLYVVAALSGLTDMDAITLSTAKMVTDGRLSADTSWRMIVTGVMSNLVFKGATVALLGHRFLLKRVAVVFGISLVGGVLLLTLWPMVG